MKNKIIAILLASLMMFSLIGCSETNELQIQSDEKAVEIITIFDEDIEAGTQGDGMVPPDSREEPSDIIDSDLEMKDASEMFTNRDLEVTDMTDAEVIILSSNHDFTIDSEGLYIVSGEVENTTIIIDANEDKVELILEDLTVVNDDVPVIYIKSADKVFVSSNGENYIAVTSEFIPDGDNNLDGVIFSRSDLVLKGSGILTINSTENGVVAKDDLKIISGNYSISAKSDGLDVNDSIRVHGGSVTIDAGQDGLHSENEEDLEKGFIYTEGGSLTITAGDDAIHATSYALINGGEINILESAEGIEATYIEINDGTIDIYATDDGINATAKSNFEVAIVVNGGTINVEMASGDTDGFDSNGTITINDGNISVVGQSTFDSDHGSTLNGGLVEVNGEVVTELPQQMMGGHRKPK